MRLRTLALAGLGLAGVGVLASRRRTTPTVPERGPLTGRHVWTDPTRTRASVKIYGTLAMGDRRVVELPTEITVGHQRLHWRAATLAEELLAAARADGIELRISSGWRPHRWESYAEYEAFLAQKYATPGCTGACAIKRGKTYLAFDSPHETGLAIDLVGSGLSTSSKNAESMRRSEGAKWLAARAPSFGWVAYKAEPWHWEAPLYDSVYAEVPPEEDE